MEPSRLLSRVTTTALAVAMCALVVFPRAGAAQTTDNRFQLGGQLVGVSSSEFDDTDVGVGVRVSWLPVALLGLDAEVTLSPSDFAGTPAFSRQRVESLFGLTVGPRLNRWRPFAKVRGGLVKFGEAPRPFACLAIFPPTLNCLMAGGHTATVWDIGGGIEFYPTQRTFVRVDVSDRAIEYPGPTIARGRRVRDDDFVDHDLRIAVGAGVRF